MISRRMFLSGGLAAALRAKAAAGLKIAVMDGVVGQSSKPEAVAVARRFGLAGLQVTLGRSPSNDRLLLEDPGLQARFLAESKQHQLPLVATYIDMLHISCLKSDPRSRDWVMKGIGITRKLDAHILMTVFFGKCAVESPRELDHVCGVFRELAPEAEKAGVILGFENLLEAADNLRALERVNSRAFKIYYDVGNATNLVGVDAPAEIRQMGRDAICQLHFKDKGYLGEGKVNYPEVLKALADIGYTGYATLETSAPSGSMEKDLRRNIDYLRGLIETA
jgi:L-ribulose-5-phosphate 3-epimerase